MISEAQEGYANGAMPVKLQTHILKLEFMNKSVVPQAKMLRVINLMTVLLHRKMRIEDIAELMDSSERTAYRYIDLLEMLDFPVDQDFDNRFFIVNTACPICSKERKRRNQNKKKNDY